jgi:hypothetical protein
MRIKSITAAAAALAVAGMVALSPAQALTPDQCFARFTGMDKDGDKVLSTAEAKQHIKGDADGDGRVTNAEFMKSCEEGIFDAMNPDY